MSFLFSLLRQTGILKSPYASYPLSHSIVSPFSYRGEQASVAPRPLAKVHALPVMQYTALALGARRLGTGLDTCAQADKHFQNKSPRIEWYNNMHHILRSSLPLLAVYVHVQECSAPHYTLDPASPHSSLCRPLCMRHSSLAHACASTLP